MLNDMKRGFVPLVVMGIVALVSALVAGGGYTAYKVNQLQEENDTIKEQLQEQKQELEQVNEATTTNQLENQNESTTTSTSTTELDVEDNQTITQKQTDIVPQASTPAVQIPVTTDVCSNISGIQTGVPSGYKTVGTICNLMEDKCSNVEGVQDVIPKNMILSKQYGCITEADLDRIEDEIRAIEEAKEEAEVREAECDEAEDQLEAAKKEYDKYRKILDNWPSGAEITQEYREASIEAVGAVNEISILQSGVSAACYGVYHSPATVDYTSLMPKGPTYTNCHYDGWGSISCTTY
jgi:outer membrane murein-binding lipoprotein Lpp